MSDPIDPENALPASARDCVSTGPPPAGVLVREPDLAWRPAQAMSKEIVLLDVQHEVDGHICHRRLVERLNTLQAVQSSSQWQVDFDPATESLTVHWLRILRDGEVIEHMDASRFRFLQREENLERCIIDGGAVLLVLLEDIRPGDVLDTAITIRTRPRLLENHFSNFTCVSYPIHIGQWFLSYRFRKGRALVWKSNIGALVPDISTDGGSTEMRWERRGIKPLAVEENVPGWHLQGGWIQVSDYSGWREVSAGLHAAWHARRDPAGLESMLGVIRASGLPLRGQVEMAIRFVQDDIRYLSMNVELGGQIPSAPGTVVKRRFGDCKDKARLLAELLEALGLPAHPLLVHSRMRRELENWLPSPLFDHAIVSYQLDGVQYCVDATISMQGGGPARRAVPRYGVGLPITSDGAAALQPVTVAPGGDGRMRLRERFEIDPSAGPSDLFVRLQVTGSEADALRAAIHSHGVDGVARDREQFYRNMHPGLARLGTMEWADDREVNALTLAERYELPGDQSNLPAPRQQSVDHHAHAITAFLPGTAETVRKRPFRLPYPVHAEHVMEVTSPSLPMFGHVTESARCREISFAYKVKPAVGTVQISYKLEVLEEEVPPEGMTRYMDALRRIYGLRNIAIGVPRTRQRLHRRGAESLLGDHAATVALVAKDIDREEEMARGSGAKSGAVPLPDKTPYREIDGITELGSDAKSRRSKFGEGPQTTMDLETDEPAPARVIPWAGAISGELPADSGDSGKASGKARSGRISRPRRRMSGNMKLGLGGCAVLVIGLPLLTWLGWRFLPGESYPSVAAYQESDGQARRDPDMAEAYRLFEAGDVAGARALFRVMADKYPLSLEVHLLSARLSVAEGDHDFADRLLTKWEQIYPTVPELTEVRIDLLLAKGDTAGAVKMATAFAAPAGAPPIAFFQLARAQVAAGNPQQAEPPLLEYLRLQGPDLHARYLLGSIFQKSGRTAEIIPLWQDFLNRNPQNDQAAVGAAQQFLEAGLVQNAADVLAAASQRIPGSAKVAFQFGSLLKSRGRPEQAFESFRRAMELDPAWIEPVLNVALMLEAAGHADALSHYQMAADRSPKDSARLVLTGKSVAAHSARGAQVFFERALLLSPDSAEAWELLAKTHEAQADPARAAAARRRDAAVLKAAGEGR